MPDSLTKLYIEITSACNLNCTMCVQRVWSEPVGMMPLATFERLIEQIREMPVPPIIHLSGYGESMTHPHFLDMIRLAKSTGAQVEATSNGVLLDERMATALLDLDMDRLVVSIDGVTANSYEDIRERSSFDLVTGNLMRLRQLRIRRRGRHGNPQLTLAFVAMKSNIADLPALPMLAARLGAWEIIVSNVVPHTPEMEKEILYAEALTSCAFRASRWVPDMSLPKLDVDEQTQEPLRRASGSTASISLLGASLSGRNDYCQFAREGYATIRWDGEVSPCLSLLHDHPEYILGRRKDVTHHSLGNINRQSLPQIWNGPEFSQFRAKLRDFPFSPCTTCGGCLWAQGFVQCA